MDARPETQPTPRARGLGGTGAGKEGVAEPGEGQILPKVSWMS
jgi:hypothetical protein